MNDYYEPASMHEVLTKNYAQYGARRFAYELANGQFKGKTYETFIADVRAVASRLIEAGYHGKHIMLQGANSYEWLVLYTAIIGYVGVCICASKDWKAYDLTHAIRVTKPSLIIYDEVAADVVSSLDIVPEAMTFHNALHSKRVSSVRDLAAHRIASDETAIVVFTTGTSSQPKAVALSLDNAIANGRALYARIPTTPDDAYYLFLPFHHIYAQACVIIAALLIGAQLYIARDVHNAREELLLSRPTILPGVPLFYERLLEAMTDDQRRTARRAAAMLNVIHAPLWVRRLVFRDVHRAMGGRIRCLSTGAALLDRGTKQLFRSMGFNVLEGYGMSESCGVIAGEYSHNAPLDAVGRPLEHIDVVIRDPDTNGYGEITIRGANLMQGYLANGKIQRTNVEKNGFFATGDVGRMDRGGNLHVRGRAGKVIVLSSGENISINELTDLVRQGNNEIRKAYFSERHGYVAAVLYTVQPEGKVRTYIDALNDTLPPYKQIRHLTVVHNFTESEMK